MAYGSQCIATQEQALHGALSLGAHDDGQRLYAAGHGPDLIHDITQAAFCVYFQLSSGAFNDPFLQCDHLFLTDLLDLFKGKGYDRYLGEGHGDLVDMDDEQAGVNGACHVHGVVQGIFGHMGEVGRYNDGLHDQIFVG